MQIQCKYILFYLTAHYLVFFDSSLDITQYSCCTACYQLGLTQKKIASKAGAYAEGGFGGFKPPIGQVKKSWPNNFRSLSSGK